MTRVIIIGGGITGLAAAYRLSKLDPTLKVTLLERDSQLGGKLLTEQLEGFTLEGAADSFLSRKSRGVGLCEELGIADQLYGRDPRHAKTFVKYDGSLYPLPSGLSGMIPTNLDALANNPLISSAGRERLAQEIDLPPKPRAAGYDDDESVGSFVSRRLGREVYEKLVEPLMSGIYAGNGEHLSLAATFPQLRELELKHGSLLKGLTRAEDRGQKSEVRGQKSEDSGPQREPRAEAAIQNPRSPLDPKIQNYPPFVSLPGGMGTLVDALVKALPATEFLTGTGATNVCRNQTAPDYLISLENGAVLPADALILTTPAFVTAQLVDELDPALAAAHAAIPYASSAIVTLAFRQADLVQPPEGYGYVIPRIANSDVLACTWSSNKWTGRAPAGMLLLRVYLGRYGQSDVTQYSDTQLLAMARQEILETLDVDAAPVLHRIYRWPLSMPQYMLGHTARLAQIEERLPHHPGLFLGGAAYRGVGIPDCIHEGENAAQAAVTYFSQVA